MKVVNVKDLAQVTIGISVAIGYFDGMHLGHQQVITCGVVNGKVHGLKSVVITFDKSPKMVLGHSKEEGAITPTSEKVRLLASMGVDYVLILPFDEALLAMSPEEFIEKYLIRLNAQYVSVGFDFRFGHLGAGDVNLLKQQQEFTLAVTSKAAVKGVKVSTTDIKEKLKAGDLEGAAFLLGRPFTVSGRVISGKKLGRTIGFPTANLQLDSGYLMPLRGVYHTVAVIEGRRYLSMTNVGTNPTVEKGEVLHIETHIFDFDYDVYEKEMRLEFVSKIRNEMKFPNLDALVKQLEQDKKFVKNLQIEA